jgi:hypothetical protein
MKYTAMNPQTPTTNPHTAITSISSGYTVIRSAKMQFESPTKKKALYKLFTLRPKPKHGCRRIYAMNNTKKIIMCAARTTCGIRIISDAKSKRNWYEKYDI